MDTFTLISDFQPAGDQPQAIEALVEGINSGVKHQTLLGVTGSGKTYTMASVIARVQKPTLVLAPNKTLAAQLYSEFAQLFPHNAVEYFVSYYDYYQPEADVPATDTYIEKDAAINEHIDKMRHSTTRRLLERRDVIVVASVSRIYGIGSPKDYAGMLVLFHNQMEVSRDDILRRLVEIQYSATTSTFTVARFACVAMWWIFFRHTRKSGRCVSSFLAILSRALPSLIPSPARCYVRLARLPFIPAAIT